MWLGNPPQAAIRVGEYKLMTWCYDIEGILGANRTGPVNAPAGHPNNPPNNPDIPHTNLFASPIYLSILMISTNDNVLCAVACIGTVDFADGPVLYHLTSDPSEQYNIAQTNPDVVRHLLARLKAHALDKENVEPQQWAKPYQGDDYFCKDCPLRPELADPLGEAWTPWINLSHVPTEAY